jgi:hypothetical protein
MKKVISFLFSMMFTGILVMFFAIAIAYATFVENDFGTVTAKILIYNSRWFEALLLLLSINLIGSIFVNKLIAKKKWPVFLFHIAFIVIAIGALFTRFVGYEGTMHIRENESSDYLISSATFVNVKATSGNQIISKEKEVMFSPYTGNRFSETITINGKSVHIENLQYMPSASESLSIDPNGEPIISFMAVGRTMQRIDFNLREGDVKKIDDITLGFEPSENKNTVNFRISDGTVFISSADTIKTTGMMQTDPEIILPGEETEINTQKAYSIGTINFAIKNFFLKGKTQLVYSQPQQGVRSTDAIHTRVSVENVSKDLIVYGSSGRVGEEFSTTINGIQISLTFGAKIIQLPFSIYLKDFQLERYPGSNSPSSYASEVLLIDDGMEKPFRIFMNNILKYQGYRFFQSSYDTDEQGTILSVNHDSLGTSITYFGYFIMTLGMLLTLFTKKSRFKLLLQRSAKLREERKKLFAVINSGICICV